LTHGEFAHAEGAEKSAGSSWFVPARERIRRFFDTSVQRHERNRSITFLASSTEGVVSSVRVALVIAIMGLIPASKASAF